MKIYRHPLCTHDLGAPRDMQDGSCDSLPVHYETTEHGTFAVSYWLPAQDDLATILAGGGIQLWVRAPGRQHPVVSLGTFESLNSGPINADIELVRGIIGKVLEGAGPMENRDITRDQIVAAMLEALQ